MLPASANLRISYLGGGYDFPEFFAECLVSIIAEGLPLGVTFDGEWEYSVASYSGLGASAARHLSFLRYYYPEGDFRKIVNAAIAIDGIQAGGWQDAIASAHDGFIKISFVKDSWHVQPLETDIHRFRRLYKIPVCPQPKKILSHMTCRESSFTRMRQLVCQGELALY